MPVYEDDNIVIKSCISNPKTDTLKMKIEAKRKCEINFNFTVDVIDEEGDDEQQWESQTEGNASISFNNLDETVDAYVMDENGNLVYKELGPEDINQRQW